MYKCICSVRSDEYKCKTKHAFFNDSHVKPLHQSKYCGAIIDNIADAPIFVLEYKYRETKLNLIHTLKHFFGRQCTVEYFYKITPC